MAAIDVGEENSRRARRGGGRGWGVRGGALTWAGGGRGAGPAPRSRAARSVPERDVPAARGFLRTGAVSSAEPGAAALA